MFCPKCKSLLLPKREEGKRTFACSSCSYKSSSMELPKFKEAKRGEKEIDIIDKDEVETLPLTDTVCEKCGHTKARYWLVQTRASDEPETKFLRCGRCSHTWRDYT